MIFFIIHFLKFFINLIKIVICQNTIMPRDNASVT